MANLTPLPSNETLEAVEIQEADIPGMLHIYATAFAVLPIDRVTFPDGITQETLDWFGEQELKAVREGPLPGVRGFIVKDKATGEVLTVAKWKFVDGQEVVVEKPPVLGTEDSESKEKKDDGPGQLPGARMEGKLVWREVHKEIKKRLLGDRKYWHLHMLATAPEHQRKGAGTLAMKWGVAQADFDGVDAFLFSTPFGKHLYEKNGYEALEEKNFDLSPWGLNEVNQSFAMLRKCRTAQ